jgi:hypothetical protein
MESTTPTAAPASRIAAAAEAAGIDCTITPGRSRLYARITLSRSVRFTREAFGYQIDTDTTAPSCASVYVAGRYVNVTINDILAALQVAA